MANQADVGDRRFALAGPALGVDLDVVEACFCDRLAQHNSHAVRGLHSVDTARFPRDRDRVASAARAQVEPIFIARNDAQEQRNGRVGVVALEIGSKPAGDRL